MGQYIYSKNRTQGHSKAYCYRSRCGPNSCGADMGAFKLKLVLRVFNEHLEMLKALFRVYRPLAKPYLLLSDQSY